MISLKEVLDIFFEMIESCVKNITLPTGDTYLSTLLYSAVIFVVSAISKLLGVITVVHWQGALLAVILLLVLAYIEGRGQSELSKLYRVAESSVTAVKKRAKSASARIKASGSSETDDGV